MRSGLRGGARRDRRVVLEAPGVDRARRVLAIAAALVAMAVVVLVAGYSLANGGVDETAAIRSELRVAGHMVQDVVPLAASTFPGNGRESVGVPEGARLHRITYRLAPGRGTRRPTGW